MRSEPEIRRATDDDLPEILDVATAALGWNPADPNEEFFRWKHFDNPHGQSPIWVATNGGEIVGFRSMLCWTFTGQAGDYRAVRAVDTATHPNHHRRGIFRISDESEPELVVSGPGIVGLAFLPAGGLVVATTSNIYRLRGDGL